MKFPVVDLYRRQNILTCEHLTDTFSLQLASLCLQLYIHLCVADSHSTLYSLPSKHLLWKTNDNALEVATSHTHTSWMLWSHYTYITIYYQYSVWNSTNDYIFWFLFVIPLPFCWWANTIHVEWMVDLHLQQIQSKLD